MRSPVPRVEASRALSGVRSSGVSRARPEAAAISTNAPRPVVEQQPVGLDRPAQGVGRLDRAPLGGVAERIGHRGQGALAAVGHRAAHDLVPAADARPAPADGGGHRHRVEGTAEGVGRDEDAQGSVRHGRYRSFSDLRRST